MSGTSATAPPLARSRRPGRPAAGGSAQRDLLLDATVDLFSRHGIAGTPVRAIASHAGVTPALVHYYFPSREQLLDAVVDERLLPLMTAVFADVPASGEVPAGTAAAMLIRIARRLIGIAAATPWLPGLWLREIAHVDGQLHERVLQRVALQRAPGVLAALNTAHARGELNPGLTPPLLMASVIGLAMLPLATRHMWQRMPGTEGLDAEVLAGHVSALLAHGLSPAPSVPPSDTAP
jgi:AcrR family transcriptional regulator